MSKEITPTAEEILHKHFKPLDPFDNICILNAMSVHTAPLRARIKELEKENERLTKLAEKRKRQLEAACADSKYFNDECDRLRESLEAIMNIIDDTECYGILKNYHAYNKATEILEES